MKYLKFLPAVAGVFLLTSCELEEQIEPAEETYTKAFIKEFGVIDPKQDWNMATRGSVTVNTPSATEVKVYKANDNGKYSLIGDFGGVAGSKALEFDMPRGTSEVLVSACGYAYKTTVGGSVSFANISTRSASTNNNDGTSAVKVAYVSDNDVTAYKFVKEITFKENTNDKDNPENCTGVYRYQQVLPEGKWNAEKEGVSKNFHFVSDGKPFVVYPVYWQTDATPEVGIAYRDENGNETKVPVYTIKSGDELMKGVIITEKFNLYYGNTPQSDQINARNGNERWSYFHINNTTNSFSKYPLDTSKQSNDYTEDDLKKLKAWIAAYYNTSEENVTFATQSYNNFIQCYVSNQVYWEEVGNVTPSAPDNSDGSQYKSKGIEVTVPNSYEFCFYVKNGENLMYTHQEWNTDNYKKQDGQIDYEQKGLHGATYTTTEKDDKGEDVKIRCLAFEDWEGDGNDVDLNDLVFYTTLAVNNTTVIIEEDKPQSWILAAEDLGSMDDFDFNDMVIEVTTPVLLKSSTTTADENTTTENTETSGTTNTYVVKVTALAAGGTLPLKLERYNSTTQQYEVLTSPVEGGSENKEQFHSWFGDGSVPYSTMINTYSATSYSTHTKEIILTEDEKNAFTLSSETGKESVDSKKVLSRMGGFSFIVDQNGDGTFTEVTKITAPQEGTAPQMICVPSTWLWPTERTNISTAYPDFGTWGANYGLATSNKWYEKPNTKDGYVVKR